MNNRFLPLVLVTTYRGLQTCGIVDTLHTYPWFNSSTTAWSTDCLFANADC